MPSGRASAVAANDRGNPVVTDQFPKCFRAVPGEGRGGAGTHCCGSVEAEQRTHLADVFAGCDDAEQHFALWRFAHDFQLTGVEHIDEVAGIALTEQVRCSVDVERVRLVVVGHEVAGASR